MNLKFALVVLGTLVGTGFAHDRGNCPILPSGKCWVDCDLKIHEIACEDAEWHQLHRDLWSYANSTAEPRPMVELILWNSPQLLNVDTNLLAPIANQLQSLGLQNLDNLRFFPMMRHAERLDDINIHNCMKVADIDLSHIPPQLKTLNIQQTSISRLEYDSAANFQFPNLTQIKYQESQLTSIRGGFFKAFPALFSLTFHANKVTLDRVDDSTFETTNGLGFFQFNGNDLRTTSDALNTQFFASILGSLKLMPKAVVDLSSNQFIITQDSLTKLDRLIPASSLSFRGNNFARCETSGLFKNFNTLAVLDIGDSYFPKRQGVFQSLPQLDILRIDSNNFGDLNNVDLWAGSTSTKLRVVEIENNSLVAMPSGNLAEIRRTLTRLDLGHNKIIFTDNIPGAPATSFSGYPSLQSLNLRQNSLISFASSMLKPLTKLQELDLSCNPFVTITKDFFVSLPETVTFLNLSFCHHHTDGRAQLVAGDAFSSLKSLHTLILNHGYFRDDIFVKLNQLPVATKQALRVLQLDGNGIRYFNLQHMGFTGFNLTSLTLKSNQIQTISFHEFADESWKRLTTLDLSDNLLTVIRENNFKGLDSLQNLYLNKNNLFRLADGAFDSLGNLQSLTLQDNRLAELSRIFTKENMKLTTLGLERNPLTTLNKTSMASLRGLQRLYLHHTKLRYLEEGVFDFMNNDKSVISLPRESLSCACNNSWIKDFINRMEFLHFVNMIIEDPTDLRLIKVSHVPKCHHHNGTMSFITEDFNCTARAAPIAPASKAYQRSQYQRFNIVFP